MVCREALFKVTGCKYFNLILLTSPYDYLGLDFGYS